MIYLLAFNMREALYYCRHAAEPPINLKGGDVVIILTDDSSFCYGLYSRRITPEDKVVRYGNYNWVSTYRKSNSL